jgi:hypothetical protein
MAGKNLRKIQPGSGKSEVCSFLKVIAYPISCSWGVRLHFLRLPADVNNL